jgi:hypothetical protein
VLDGTFEKRPNKDIYGQVYVLVAVYSDLPERQRSFVCAIAFLPNKTEATYIK